MRKLRRFQTALDIRGNTGSAFSVKQPDPEVFVKTESVGKFFLESFGDALGHGGIKRRSVSPW
jgi:hypothetical protein